MYYEEPHRPTMLRLPYFSTRWIYWARCSCGLYRSGKHADDLAAWKAWWDHARSKRSKGATS